MYDPVLLKSGESLAGYDECDEDMNCPEGTECGIALLETCTTVPLCWPSGASPLECADGGRLGALEPAIDIYVCSRN